MVTVQMDILPRKSTLLIALVVLALLIAILASGNVAFGCAVLITGPLLVSASITRLRRCWDDEVLRSQCFLPSLPSRAPPSPAV